jgi:hypothetical protein
VQNTEFELRQCTNLRVEALAFDPQARRALAADSNHAVEFGGSDPAGENSGGSVAAEENV